MRGSRVAVQGRPFKSVKVHSSLTGQGDDLIVRHSLPAEKVKTATAGSQHNLVKSVNLNVAASKKH